MKILRLLSLLGLDPLRGFRNLRGVPKYVSNYLEFRKQLQNSVNSMAFGKVYPCLTDHLEKSGTASGAYFHQDLLVASRIFELEPENHMDVGSRIDGFVAHVASFRSIQVIDIRDPEEPLERIQFVKADLMAELPASLIGVADSLSCLHALEHFGLGRYGDSIQVNGHILGLINLLKILRPNGILHLSVPIGPLRIEFNGHRVFSIGYLLEMFKEKLQIVNFSFVDDQGHLHKNVKLDAPLIDRNCDCISGCGIFELQKLG